jgi:quercetin dioxygenase-like cupin family protein
VEVLEWKVEVRISKDTHILESGSTIIMPADIPHAVKAREKFKMLLTMIKG